ncbi:FadR/GntR family transcriptional regulator [Amycolatopsis sp. FDAARGOS 1241]|uniref:FadR/GntR family transcriptional regulator n=1 Tax=Amycolatopsis sp. FDAARGOS 1241 TaxID=2778070 RepID=UPI0019525B3C|nr:FCD domain-containing protein [Amycolatopsis sp. FDAARGOS 1241]QRP47680.1 FadR family transcriptional regulator [Amycolatopsis sp. FDAARGOS 1241]
MTEAHPKPGLSEQLVEGLLQLIAEERLAPGDTLPTVRVLAERFSVTTPTIREALRRLQTTDAVRMRHGSGIYVGDGIHRTLMPNPNSAPMKDELILQLVAARLTIEPGIAALSATNRTEESLQRLELALDTAKRDRADPGPHLNFHRELAGGSGNQVLFEIVDSLLTARGREQKALRALIEDRKRDYEEHLAIYEAVRAGDAAQAEERTRRHLEQLRTDVARQLGRAG